mmetsp:Transcript_73738/g.162821  ORF Transcript_73738/g.162821 Transcript_73738/m.162821 type:complete len:112 (+) Transcript_73738:1152-1487(+)
MSTRAAASASTTEKMLRLCVHGRESQRPSGIQHIADQKMRSHPGPQPHRSGATRVYSTEKRVTVYIHQGSHAQNWQQGLNKEANLQETLEPPLQGATGAKSRETPAPMLVP